MSHGSYRMGVVVHLSEEFKRTDFFVEKLYVPKGFFTPPFETKASLEERLKKQYSEVQVQTVRSEGIFCCRK